MRFWRERHRHEWQPVSCHVVNTYEVWGGRRGEYPRLITTQVLRRCNGCGDLSTTELSGSWTWEQVSTTA